LYTQLSEKESDQREEREEFSGALQSGDSNMQE